MTNTWQVDDMIVCIDTSRATDPPNIIVLLPGQLDGLTEGDVYTIRDIYVDCYWGVCVRLKEIYRTPFPWETEEPGFLARRFRPVKKTSIDCFKSILTSTPELVPACL